jgi:hypothetical protein
MRTSRLVLTAALAAVFLAGVVPYLVRLAHERDLEAGARFVNNPALLDSLDPPVAGNELVQRELGFRVAFPGMRGYRVLPAGGWIYSSTEGPHAFGVAGRDIPEGAPAVDILAGAIQGVLAGLPHATVEQLTPCFEVPGARGVDVQLEDGDPTAQLRMRLLVRPGRLFVVSTTATDDIAAQRFIGSFALLSPAVASAGQGATVGS